MEKDSKDKKKQPIELMTGVIGTATQIGKRGADIVVGAATKFSKKGTDLVTGAVSQTAASGKAFVDGIAKSTKEMSEKSKAESLIRRIKKYNPLFVEEYASSDFCMPSIICIVDDAVRRDIDVCQGAIGWRELRKGVEVLFLYDEFIPQCGLEFLPVPACDEVYCVDSFNPKCFVKLDYIFQRAHEEKLAELEYIAYSLGAKSCVVEIEEAEAQYDKRAGNAHLRTGAATAQGEMESTSDKKMKRVSRSETKFSGNDTAVIPTLKWFAHDQNILNLIEYRCKGGNVIESKTLRLSGASSATLSRNVAASIDSAGVGKTPGGAFSMEDKSIKESTSCIVYHLEF